MICAEMCVQSYFCPAVSRCGALFFDEAAGTCVCQTDCSVGAPTLEPGLALGRPFVDARDARPVTASPVAWSSDWAEEF